MKIAIVYDWLDKWGGVERLLLALHEKYPDAQWYTSYLDTKTASWANKLHVKTSFIQKLPAFIRKNRILSSILYPYAFESFDFSAYDVVISVSSSFAKGIITKPNTKHISYILTPTRYLWGMSDEYITGWKKLLSAPFLSQLRKWDYTAAQRPDNLVTLSHFVAKRIKTFYNRKAEVLYPPFDFVYWKKVKEKMQKPKDVSESTHFYLLVSRLEPYKKVDLAIKTFNEHSDKLIVVGKGSQLNALQEEANKNSMFLHSVTDSELAWLYSNAKALIMPQEEEFGYVALEAQFFGCPIISYADSGTAEIIHSSKYNSNFNKQTESSLKQSLERFTTVAYNGKKSRIEDNFFEQFNKEKFIDKLEEYIIK